MTQTEEKKERKRRRKRRRYILTGAVVSVLLISFVLIWKQFHLSEQLDKVMNPYAKRLGPDEAAVKIVEYSDFQCPGCRDAQSVLKELMNKYNGKIQLEFRHFPLKLHRWAALAHQAAECANQAGRFWKYHDLLYENQPVWSVSSDPSERFAEYAKDTGLDTEKFKTCLESGGGKIADIVSKDTGSGNVFKVNSTPTFFINDTRIVGITDLKRKLELEIGRILRETMKE
jgi:protein-disulfide isomerase